MMGPVRRLALAALAEGARQHTCAALAPALAGHDPLVRYLARRRTRRALTRAEDLTSLSDEAQYCRIAACVLDGRIPEADYDDAPGLESELRDFFATLKAPKKTRWVTLAAVLFVVLGITLPPGVWWWTRPFDPAASAAGKIFADHVPSFLTGLVNDRDEKREQARTAATDENARKAIGDAAADRLGKLFNAAADVRAAAGGTELKAAATSYSEAAANLNAELQDRRLPYFVDADIWNLKAGSTPVLLSFYIQREALAAAGDARVRAVHLWRLDNLNLRQNYLGYTRPDTPAALVLLDQIESRLVRFVLPALPEGEAMWIVDDKTREEAKPWAVAIGETAAAIVRRHHVGDANTASFAMETKQALTRVGALLATRRKLIMSWRESMAKHQTILRVPTRLIPRAEYSSELRHLIPTGELSEWDALHDELLESDHLEAFVALRDLYADSTERHEIQHRLDYERNGGLKMPTLIAKRLGVDPDKPTEPRSRAGRARDELSAYLASIAQSTQAPLVGLTLLQVFLLDRNESGGAYSYAALAALEGIATELAIDVDAILTTRRIKRPQVAQLLTAVAEHPSKKIRAAAASFYEKAYGHALLSVSVERIADNPSWRH